MLKNNPALRPWGAMFLLLIVGVAVLVVGAVIGSVVLAVIGAVLIVVALLGGAYLGEKAAGQIQRDPDFGRRMGGHGP